MFNKTKFYQDSEMAELYLKYRPTYDAEIFETIVSFCQQTTSAEFALALDVGCGSGQSSVPLKNYFQKVIGLDVSEAQIARAPKRFPNVSFRVGPAEDLSFVDEESVDLVTSAIAVHWMDVQRFHAEVERVLKPGGSFVVYYYVLPELGDLRAQEIIRKLDQNAVDKYAPSTYRQEMADHHHNYSIPFPRWHRNDSLKMERSWTVDELVGFLRSWTPYYKRYLENPADGASDIRRRLQAVCCDGAGEDGRIRVTFSILMMMGHKPHTSSSSSFVESPPSSS